MFMCYSKHEKGPELILATGMLTNCIATYSLMESNSIIHPVAIDSYMS